MKYKIQSIQEVIDHTIDEKAPSISFGYRFFRHIEPGLINIVGRPSTGKTSLLVNIIQRIAHKSSKILVISNDNKISYVRRLIALESNLQNDDVISLDDLYKSEKSELDRRKQFLFNYAKEKVGKYNVSFIDSYDADFSLEDFLEIIHSIKRESDELLTVFIDANISSSSDFLSKLSTVAKQEKLVVVATYTLPRDLINKEITLSNLRDAFGSSFERDANMIVLISRTTFVDGDKKQQSDLIYARVIKNRFGPTGNYPLIFSSSILSIFEVSQELEDIIKKEEL